MQSFCFGITTGSGHHYENYIGRNRYYKVERVRNLLGREKKCRKIKASCVKYVFFWFKHEKIPHFLQCEFVFLSKHLILSDTLFVCESRPQMNVQQLWKTLSTHFNGHSSFKNVDFNIWVCIDMPFEVHLRKNIMG